MVKVVPVILRNRSACVRLIRAYTPEGQSRARLIGPHHRGLPGRASNSWSQSCCRFRVFSCVVYMEVINTCRIGRTHGDSNVVSSRRNVMNRRLGQRRRARPRTNPDWFWPNAVNPTDATERKSEATLRDHSVSARPRAIRQTAHPRSSKRTPGTAPRSKSSAASSSHLMPCNRAR